MVTSCLFPPDAKSPIDRIRKLEEKIQQMNRKDILLRAAYDLLKRSTEPGYVQDAQGILVRYDEANCDGYCLMDDIATELDIEDGTKPIPLGPEDE